MDLGKTKAYLKKRWFLPMAVVLIIGFFAGPYFIGRACYAGNTVYVLDQSRQKITNRLGESPDHGDRSGQNGKRPVWAV